MISALHAAIAAVTHSGGPGPAAVFLCAVIGRFRGDGRDPCEQAAGWGCKAQTTGRWESAASSPSRGRCPPRPAASPQLSPAPAAAAGRLPTSCPAWIDPPIAARQPCQARLCAPAPLHFSVGPFHDLICPASQRPPPGAMASLADRGSLTVGAAATIRRALPTAAAWALKPLERPTSAQVTKPVA